MIEPRTYTDLPREELLRRADAAIKQFNEPGIKAEVHFKFTCEKCGARVMLTEPNILFENGECCECGHTTKIVEGGFTMHMEIGGEA